MHDTPGGLVHSNFVRTTPPKTPLPQPSLRAGVVVADREGFEPFPCNAETPNSTGNERLAEKQSSRISSRKTGETCTKLTTHDKTGLSQSDPQSPDSKAFGASLTTGDNPCTKDEMADREGFEPSIPFLVYSLSRGALSTTQPPVLGEVVVDDGRSWNISAGFRQVGCIIIWRNFQIMKI